MATLAEELADDWEDFDGLEIVTLHRPGPDGSEEIEISYVDDDGVTQGASLRRQASRQDAVSLGIASLTGDETVFEIPQSIAGTVRPGNQLVDADGVAWNINTAQLATLRTRWRCLCTRVET